MFDRSGLLVLADDGTGPGAQALEAMCVDYLYLSYTNATAFSPTDVMPVPRWAKSVRLGNRRFRS